jgi:hypothetical protein
MRKGEALYTFFMNSMGKREVKEDGTVNVWLEGDNAVDILVALHGMPDEVFDAIVKAIGIEGFPDFSIKESVSEDKKE